MRHLVAHLGNNLLAVVLFLVLLSVAILISTYSQQECSLQTSNTNLAQIYDQYWPPTRLLHSGQPLLEGQRPREVGTDLFITPCRQRIFDRVDLSYFKTEEMKNKIRQARLKWGFDMILGTSHSKNKVRREDINKEVKDIFDEDMPFKWFLETDASTLTDDDIHCFADRARWMAMLPYLGGMQKGNVAVAIGHQTIYYAIYRLGLKNVLVLEDDASFSNFRHEWKPIGSGQNSGLWKNVRKEMPQDYDLAMVGICLGMRPGVAPHHGHVRYNGTLHWFLTQTSRCSHAYLVSTKGAENMIRSLPLLSTSDWQINYAAGFKSAAYLQYGYAGLVQDMKVFWIDPPLLDQQQKQSEKTWLQDGQGRDLAA